MGGWLSWIYHSQSNTACCMTNKVVIFYVVVVVSTCIQYMYLPYQTSSLLHKNHKGLILQCTYSRQTPPLKHTPLVKGPTHEPPHRVTIFDGNSLLKSFLSPANSTGYQRKKRLSICTLPCFHCFHCSPLPSLSPPVFVLLHFPLLITSTITTITF